MSNKITELNLTRPIIFFGGLVCKLATEEELWVELSKTETPHLIRITLKGFGKQFDYVYNILKLAESTLDVEDLISIETERLLGKFYDAEEEDENEF